MWGRCSFLRDLDLFLKLRHVGGVFQDVLISSGTFSPVELERQISAAFLTVITRSSVRLSISVWFQRLCHNLVGDRIDPTSIFHDLAVRFHLLLRKLFILTIILVSDLDISVVRELS